LNEQATKVTLSLELEVWNTIFGLDKCDGKLPKSSDKFLNVLCQYNAIKMALPTQYSIRFKKPYI